ncbi:DNA polymerase III subunit delta' [Streptococcus criceti]|uniref:DNA polymerase III, delta' subunit n=1 Tax=Streptococcus criceti HS-6 TaxID=873449 RepID=G5JSM2_STRCG|nr:DNA polymerase III subunit delta' [Streptococcus criceti]EHI74313.1 DNA polymerase III, delta' subunit [Streptococcus criceti HS-6]SUN37502.1 DNA polymerase III subunit delta' [Streptococcus criceti]
MTLADLQPKIFQEFHQILQRGRLSHAYLFSGNFGSYEMAIFLAQSQFCENLQDNLPCGQCRECHLIAERDFSDVKVIEPQGNVIKTDTIRELLRDFTRSGFEGQSQVFIIRDADKMHINAANSLLKFIEEPQSSSYMILLTSDESRVLPTIKSRCQIFRFPKNQEYLKNLLEQNGLLKAKASLIAAVADDGASALALTEMTKFDDLCRSLEKFIAGLDKDSDQSFLQVTRLASLATDKAEQDLAFKLLLVMLGRTQQPRWVTKVYQARQMWLSNVSFQNVLEYMVLE